MQMIEITPLRKVKVWLKESENFPREEVELIGRQDNHPEMILVDGDGGIAEVNINQFENPELIAANVLPYPGYDQYINLEQFDHWQE